jgi:hypothetical protein
MNIPTVPFPALPTAARALPAVSSATHPFVSVVSDKRTTLASLVWWTGVVLLLAGAWNICQHLSSGSVNLTGAVLGPGLVCLAAHVAFYKYIQTAPADSFGRNTHMVIPAATLLLTALDLFLLPAVVLVLISDTTVALQLLLGTWLMLCGTHTQQ